MDSFSLMWPFSVFLFAMALLTVGHALLNKRDSKSAFGWIALCIILPLAGPVIYLLFGINRVNIRAQKDYDIKLGRHSLSTVPDPDNTCFRPRSLAGELLTGKGLSDCTELLLLENGENLYPCMLEAIDQAQHRILLASYIFDGNDTGKRFVAALARAQARGVEVKVIIDGLGEFMHLPRIGTLLKKHQINFQRFNPIRLFPPALNINLRSHRKLLIVDGVYAFTGGQNIGDRHLAQCPDNPHRVEDIHFRLRGKIVDELEWAFWRDWLYCTRDKKSDFFTGNNASTTNPPLWSRLILDGPNKDLDKLNNLIMAVVSSATTRVWIMTPYFLPASDLAGALVAARLRGVDVRILLPQKNNIPLAHWASMNMIAYLLEQGISIAYQPPPFVHSKLLLIDADYALVGTANIDPRSLRLNYELGIELFGQRTNAQLADYFQKRMHTAQETSAEQIHARPLHIKLRDSLAWLFSPYL
ncbi:MAG: phospholipase D-like domain-containing protein [Pseudomonadales bacterium]|nr:phospholipase D-like domain-containing protein [Pseudomonadales bacterium]